MSTKGRLRRRFPASCIAVPVDTIREADFRDAISESLTKMSQQAVPAMRPDVRGSGGKSQDPNETTDPAIVTGLLASFLLAHGKPNEESFGITKHTRDDIISRDGGKPWRRSPIWLVIRVLLQLILHKSGPDDAAPDLTYKQFMIFFMSHILKLGLDSSLRSAVLYSMNAKIVQRCLKLGPQGDQRWLEFVRDTSRRATKELEKRWQTVRGKESKAAPWSSLELSPTQLQESHSIELPQLDAFLSSIDSRGQHACGRKFEPKPFPIDTSASELPSFSEPCVTRCERILNLFAIEEWVRTELQCWIEQQDNEDEICRGLYELIQSYHDLAKITYVGSPESLSIMYLTIFELWVACDQVLVEAIPLVEEFSPQIPPDI